MSQQALMVEVVTKLLQDKNNDSIKDELPTVICSLLRPFVSRSKPSKQLDSLISNMIRSYGICSRCKNGRLKNLSDIFCKYCKSVIKDQAKKVIK